MLPQALKFHNLTETLVGLVELVNAYHSSSSPWKASASFQFLLFLPLSEARASIWAAAEFVWTALLQLTSRRLASVCHRRAAPTADARDATTTSATTKRGRIWNLTLLKIPSPRRFLLAKIILFGNSTSYVVWLRWELQRTQQAAVVGLCLLWKRRALTNWQGRHWSNSWNFFYFERTSHSKFFPLLSSVYI